MRFCTLFTPFPIPKEKTATPFFFLRYHKAKAVFQRPGRERVLQNCIHIALLFVKKNFFNAKMHHFV